MNHFDRVVIGCGGGGYNTALRASQLGMSVACVERAAHIGGTGMRTGCFPSRLLLHASARYDLARRNEDAQFGIDCIPTLDFARLMAHKAATINTLADSAPSGIVSART